MRCVKSKTELVHACVYQNILVILIEDVCQNVSLIQIVHKMKLVEEINVKTHVLGYVEQTLNAKQLTMYQCVLVPMDILEIRSDIVQSFLHNVSILNKHFYFRIISTVDRFIAVLIPKYEYLKVLHIFPFLYVNN